MLSVPENKSNLCGGLAIQQKRAATYVAIETSVAEDYVSCLRHVDARQTLLLRSGCVELQLERSSLFLLQSNLHIIFRRVKPLPRRRIHYDRHQSENDVQHNPATAHKVFQVIRFAFVSLLSEFYFVGLAAVTLYTTGIS